MHPNSTQEVSQRNQAQASHLTVLEVNNILYKQEKLMFKYILKIRDLKKVKMSVVCVCVCIVTTSLIICEGSDAP